MSYAPFRTSARPSCTPREQERVRDAADTLIFAATYEEARETLDDVEVLAEQLVESGRWSEERAAELAAGPHGLRAGRHRRVADPPGGYPASMADAVVIGAGPNGLVAANKLADAGWDVIVLEAQPEPGGAVRSAPLTLPGFTHDRFSAFYPLGVGSPHIASLRLEEHGLRWRAAPVVVADPLRGRHGRDPLARPRGDLRLRRRRRARATAPPGASSSRGGTRVGPRFMAALLDPFPPVRNGAPARAALGGPRGAARLRPLRPALRAPLRRSSASAATRPARLLAGNALHPDITPDTPGGALFGMIAGRPRPAARLAGARGRRRAAHRRARRPPEEQGRPRRVRRARRADRRARAAARSACATADGREAEARRAVLADTGRAAALPRAARARARARPRASTASRRFQYDAGTVKVDWALDGPIPWAAPDVGARRHGPRDRRHRRAHGPGLRARRAA